MAHWPSSHTTASFLSTLTCLFLLYLGMNETLSMHFPSALSKEWIAVAALCCTASLVVILSNVAPSPAWGCLQHHYKDVGKRSSPA